MGRGFGGEPARQDPVTNQHLQNYAAAHAEMGRLQAPVLARVNDAHERLWVAALDGTGNSMLRDSREQWSAVARIFVQVEGLENQGIRNIRGGYVEGIGTQRHFIAEKLDGAFAYSFDERVETAYLQFCKQAKKWLDEDPQAKIRMVGVGFSRGAEEVAALNRMIEERGIMNPDTAQIDMHNGLVQRAVYRDQLVPPGKTLQAVMLFDPVSTNNTEHDRRLGSSTVSGFGIISTDRRDQFKANMLLPEGLTEQGRFLTVTTPGAHSDSGNAYASNGLGVLNFNMAIDYLNSLSDRDFLKKQDVVQDPAKYTITRSEDHMFLYTTRGYDADGIRDRTYQLGSDAQCKVQQPLPDCFQKVPMNPALEGELERYPVRMSPQAEPPRMPDPAKDADKTSRLFNDITDAALRNDPAGMRQSSQIFLATDAAQQWLQQGRESNAQAASLAAQEQLIAQQEAATRLQTQSNPVLSR